MLESIVTNQPKLSKEEYKPYHDALVDRLVVLQQEAKKAGTGVVVLFEGWKGAGKGSRISDLIYHLDARGVSVHVTEDFDPAEAERTRSSDFGATGYYPTMQQFWKALGPRDAITLFDRGWYSALIDHVFNERAAQELSDRIHQDWPNAEITIMPCGGLCSYYAEEDGLIIGYGW